ncbi:hypothetical protein [Sphingomonas sp. OTU376]
MSTRLRRLGWFMGLWMVSALTVAVLAYALRGILMLIATGL